MEGMSEKVQHAAEVSPIASGPGSPVGGPSASPGARAPGSSGATTERDPSMILSRQPDGSNTPAPALTLPARQVLPSTRDSVTHKFTVGNHEGYLTIGLHDDGRPGEVFIKMSKEGSTISGLCQAFCRALSLAMQHGLSVPDVVARFKGMRFEPMGMTSNPEIPEASSIVDYVARYIEVNFVKDRA